MRTFNIITNKVTQSTKYNPSNRVITTAAKESFKNMVNIFLEMHAQNSIEITQICLKVVQNEFHSELHNIPQAFIDSLINLHKASGININGISSYFTKFLAIPYITQVQEKSFNENGNFNVKNFIEWLSQKEFTSIMPNIINNILTEDLSGLIKNRHNIIQFWNNGEDGIYAIDLAKLIKSPLNLTTNNTQKRKFDASTHTITYNSKRICSESRVEHSSFTTITEQLNQPQNEQRLLLLTKLNKWAHSQHQATSAEINAVNLRIIQSYDHIDITSIVITENVSIPEEVFAHLPNITNLILNNNAILPKQCFSTSLKYIKELSLFENTANPQKAQILPKKLFCNLSQLTTLNINVSGKVNQVTLPKFIYLPKLENLYLKIAENSRSENIDDTNEREFPYNIIQCFPNLKSLNLENFTIDTINGYSFDGMRCNSTLQQLTLKNSDLLEIGVAAFSSFSALTHLTIDGFRERKLFKNTDIFTGLKEIKKITIDNYTEVDDDVADGDEKFDDWWLTPNLDGLKTFLESNPNVECECPYLDEKSIAQIAASQPHEKPTDININ